MSAYVSPLDGFGSHVPTLRELRELTVLASWWRTPTAAMAEWVERSPVSLIPEPDEAPAVKQSPEPVKRFKHEGGDCSWPGCEESWFVVDSRDIAALRDAGWGVSRGKDGHLKPRCPDHRGLWLSKREH